MTFAQFAQWFSGKPTVTLNSSYSPSADSVSPVNALCQFQIENDGDIGMTAGSNTVTDGGDWLAPKTNFSDFECRLVQNSGTALGGAALNTWLNCGTTRTWTLARNTDGTNTASATLSIGLAGQNTALKTSTINFTANRASP